MMPPGAARTRSAMNLDDLLSAYTSGLDAEIGLLQQVAGLAADQRLVSTGPDLDLLRTLADHRSALMAALSEIEARIAPLRRTIVEHLPHITARPGFPQAQARHREAEALVGAISASDDRLVEEIQTALLERRQLAHALETGGATLAAYRRVLAPTIASAELVDRRG